MSIVHRQKRECKTFALSAPARQQYVASEVYEMVSNKLEKS